MRDFGSTSFGDLYADGYDAGLRNVMEENTAATVEVLAELAAGGPVLEFAIGTGRIALPLAERGLAVHGIEASDQMVAKMREKPGGADIPVVIGDMSEARTEGAFDLVVLVFNTIFNLTTQEAQVRCFQNAADHMSDKGLFVVETYIPDLSDFVDGRAVRGTHVLKDMARIEIIKHDPVAQTLDFQRVVFRNEGTRLQPLAMRYIWPAEMDLMARLAGLELRERWADWDRSPFAAESRSHVSLYQRGAASI